MTSFLLMLIKSLSIAYIAIYFSNKKAKFFTMNFYCEREYLFARNSTLHHRDIFEEFNEHGELDGKIPLELYIAYLCYLLN